jgi:hypothetical protein
MDTITILSKYPWYVLLLSGFGFSIVIYIIYNIFSFGVKVFNSWRKQKMKVNEQNITSG